MSNMWKLLSVGLALLQPVHSQIQLETRHALDSSIANIHVRGQAENNIDVTFGACDGTYNDHHIKRNFNPNDLTRLVWVIPAGAPESGCLSAWDTDTGSLKGRSTELQLHAVKAKQRMMRKRGLDPVDMTDGRFELDGPWFDGVAYLKGRKVNAADEAAAKLKKIGIVGGGMSGLMTGLLLDSVGMHNWEISESSKRVGGRIRTKYLEGGPEDYQYAEMGPMRFPHTATLNGKSMRVSDHQLVFDLVEVLNSRNNKSDPHLLIKWIEFIQTNPNVPHYIKGIRNRDGSIPTAGEAANDPRFQSTPYPGVAEVNQNIGSTFLSMQNLTDLATNMFKVHEQFIDQGWDSWSEFAYIRQYLKKSVETSIMGVSPDGGGADSAYWTAIFETTYFMNSTFKTMDHGVEVLPKAFAPLIKDRVHYSRRVSKLSYNDHSKKVTVWWKPSLESRTLDSSTYDYAVVAVPFSQVRKWRLPTLTPMLRTAIARYGYFAACKVALQFETRFWEHLSPPIVGGCTSTDLPGIGQFCYPSYTPNAPGRGVLLASYTSGDDGYRYLALSDAEHVQHVLEGMAEIHGNVVFDQYTGRYNRQCWLLDEDASAAWAQPTAGQHEAFIPEFFGTHNATIFVGEHTSYTHAWIASALESAIRGTVQLCLDLGLVDEAKTIVNTWMARWIDI